MGPCSGSEVDCEQPQKRLIGRVPLTSWQIQHSRQLMYMYGTYRISNRELHYCPQLLLSAVDTTA